MWIDTRLLEVMVFSSSLYVNKGITTMCLAQREREILAVHHDSDYHFSLSYNNHSHNPNPIITFPCYVITFPTIMIPWSRFP